MFPFTSFTCIYQFVHKKPECNNQVFEKWAQNAVILISIKRTDDAETVSVNVTHLTTVEL